MFTGIIEETGTIRSIRNGNMTVGAIKVVEDVRTGDSINVDGVCLTVVSFTREGFTVDIMPETLKRSVFRTAAPGKKVNLERAVRLSDRLGGHIVSGHIDDTGTISEIRNEGNSSMITFSGSGQLLRYIVEKGSVAIDGISLTVAAVSDHSFSVGVIPHTQSLTTLLSKKKGDMVNIECDIIAKYVEKLTIPDNRKNSLDMNFLTEQGFI